MEKLSIVLPDSSPRQSEPLWTWDDVAAHLNVSKSTVKRYRRAGLPAKRIGGLIRFHPEEVRAWVEEQAAA